MVQVRRHAHAHTPATVTGLAEPTFSTLCILNLLYALPSSLSPALSSSEPDSTSYLFIYLFIFPTKLSQVLALCPGNYRELRAQVEEEVRREKFGKGSSRGTNSLSVCKYEERLLREGEIWAGF